MSPATFDPIAHTSTPRERLLVDPHWISGHREDPAVRIVEVDVSSAAYDEGHVPGAILWNAYTDLRGDDYRPIDAVQLADLLSTSGISRESTIVFYGYGAYLGFWVMKRHGHERVVLMDGPRERWVHDGFQWSTGVPVSSRSRYMPAVEDGSVAATRETVLESIGRDDVVLVDVRSDAEFAGERFWPSGATQDAGRAGHIPGAVHVPFELVRDDRGALKPAKELLSLFESRRIAPDRRVVTYCTIGNRASQVWFVLRHVLGYPRASVYYGSWVEWGKLDTTPIET